MTSSQWWTRPFRVFQTNLREVDAGLDVDKTLEHIVSLGANTWLLNTAGIASFYPSRLPFQRPVPFLSDRPSGDLIADAIPRAHERGVRVISRVDLSKVHADVAAEHPEWLFVGASGAPQIYNGLYSTCPSGDYYQHRSVDIIGEVLDNYAPDGFFFNMFQFKQIDYSGVYHGICHCNSCVERFRERYGMDLPAEHDFTDPAYLAWLSYTRETINEASARVVNEVSSRRPDCAVLLKEISSVIFREANNAVDRPQPIWAHWAGELVKDVLGTEPDKPMVVNSVMFLDIPYRFTAEQPGMVALHLLQTMAHGANPMAYMIGLPDLFTPTTFERVRDIFQFHKKHEGLFDKVRSAARVALLSSQTRDEFYSEAQTTRATTERRGIHRALIEAHIPFDIIGPDALKDSPDGLLARYDVVVAPDNPELGEVERRALDAYVAAGGGLVATWDAATSRPDRTPGDRIGLESLGSSSVLERKHGPADNRASYVRPVEGEEEFTFAHNRFIPIDRDFNVVDVKPGAAVPMTYLPPSLYGPPELCYWTEESDHPGVVTYRYGKGRSAYIPWPIGTLFHALSIPEYRELLERAIDHVSRAPRQLRTNAPAQVETVVRRNGDSGTEQVFLINYTGHDGRAYHDPLPILDVEITLQGAATARAAYSTRLERELSVTSHDGAITVSLPRLEAFDVIVLT